MAGASSKLQMEPQRLSCCMLAGSAESGRPRTVSSVPQHSRPTRVPGLRAGCHTPGADGVPFRHSVPEGRHHHHIRVCQAAGGAGADGHHRNIHQQRARPSHRFYPAGAAHFPLLCSMQSHTIWWQGACIQTLQNHKHGVLPMNDFGGACLIRRRCRSSCS